MRHELEIALMTLNGNKFIGTITPQEAKFSIFRDSFDEVHFAFRGVPRVMFKLYRLSNLTLRRGYPKSEDVR